MNVEAIHERMQRRLNVDEIERGLPAFSGSPAEAASELARQNVSHEEACGFANLPAPSRRVHPTPPPQNFGKHQDFLLFVGLCQHFRQEMNRSPNTNERFALMRRVVESTPKVGVREPLSTY